jgi:hypothetical protein
MIVRHNLLIHDLLHGGGWGWGEAAHMTDTTRHQTWQSTPSLPDHAGSIPVHDCSAYPWLFGTICLYTIYCMEVGRGGTHGRVRPTQLGTRAGRAPPPWQIILDPSLYTIVQPIHDCSAQSAYTRFFRLYTLHVLLIHGFDNPHENSITHKHKMKLCESFRCMNMTFYSIPL